MRVKTEAAHGLELRGSGESGWRKVGTFLWGIFYLKKASAFSYLSATERPTDTTVFRLESFSNGAGTILKIIHLSNY